MFRKAHTDVLKPGNWHLLDEDAVVILEPVYSESDKCNLEEDEDIMIAIFGTLEHGQEMLGAHSEIACKTCETGCSRHTYQQSMKT